MKKLVVLLLATLVATSAFAVVDPDPDMMGIYFDLTADNNCLTAPNFAQFDAYLVLTNSTAAQINAYEMSYTNVFFVGGVEDPINANSFFQFQTVVANGVVSGVNVAPPGTPLAGDLIVGLAAPLPYSDAIILHKWQYGFFGASPGWSVEMYIGPSSAPSLPGGLPVVQGTDTGLMTVGYSTGGADVPVATINGDCVVAVEEASWGSVKSLYR
jgi:hypothetical protein